MRTARCVASQVVPRRRTTPRTISAATAPARCAGDGMEVTYTVALTRVNMAARVIAMIRATVTMEARIFFMAMIARWGLARTQKDSAGEGKNECGSGWVSEGRYPERFLHCASRRVRGSEREENASAHFGRN